MRYITPPKIMSGYCWHIGNSFRPENYQIAANDCTVSIFQYISKYGKGEHIIDARVFRSILVKELLT